MKFEQGNKVEHTNAGHGIFIRYMDQTKTGYYDDCIVKFNADAQYSQDKEMTVKIGHLTKIKANVIY